ncbi:MAG: UMP kinase [Thaumarchaeota archaeon]|nr:UMP kinase [Nitrososphaerota archaeon]
MVSNLVIKLGGHLISTQRGINLDLLKAYASLLSSLYSGGRWCIIVGGGEEARRYIQAARSLGLSESLCDSIAVKITRIHARILAALIGEKAYQEIPESLEEIIEYASLGRIVVAGGLQPAQSTTAVAALAAEALKAEKLIIATDVDGVYTSDPKKDPDAKLLEKVTLSKLEEILSESPHVAGEYKLIDMLALKILRRSKIRTIVLNGNKPENLEKAIRGEKIGTLITPE